MRNACLVLLTLLAWPSLAQEADRLAVDGAACRWVSQHVPAEDAAFKPGVDLRGRAVAPADLTPAPSVRPPPQVSIDLLVPLDQLFPQGAPRPFGRAELSVGQVTVDVASGLVSYNGQPLGDPELGRLAMLCRDRSALPATASQPK